MIGLQIVKEEMFGGGTCAWVMGGPWYLILIDEDGTFIREEGVEPFGIELEYDLVRVR